MFNWYRDSWRGQPSRVNTLFPSYSGFGEDRYRSSNVRPWNRYRPRYSPGRFRPIYEPFFWRSYDHVNEPDEPEEPVEPEEEPVDEPEEPVEEVPTEPVAVDDVDLMITENKKQHHTKDFGEDIFAVRRGQGFSIKVKVNRKYNKSKDHLVLIFEVGPRPQGSKNTMERLHVETEKPVKDNPEEWSAVVTSVEESTTAGKSEITVDVTPAADCPVGKYKVKVIYYRKEGGKQQMANRLVEEIYILFNAWCKDDQVYLESEDERQEYVLNQTGRIYNSHYYGRVKGRTWSFGQFSKHAIRAAVHLLELSKVDTKAHGNATHVTRALSAMVNVNDDNGVLIGNWSGNYDGGESPSKWTGSVDILKKYMQTGTGVKFGQCWVFSGLTTTLGRTLGIPTRSVTNFDSAHDKDKSLTIDKHIDTNGDPLRDYDDSVWNFHVWNEAWFKRPDLPEGYDGWQAFDATPQESSENLMQCGPAPIKAIKEGNVYLGYDAGFIYGEVNGTRMTWEVENPWTSYEEFHLIKVNSTGVGTKISTKAVKKDERQDVTLDYKYPEGSTEEDEANRRAYKYSSRKTDILAHLDDKVTEDVHFNYTSHMAENGDIKVEIEATNTSNSRRSFTLSISSHASYYTGILGELLSREKLPVSLKPNEATKKEWSLKAKDYLNEIDEDAMIKIVVGAKVKPTNQVFSKDESFPLDKPDLDMTVSEIRPKAGEEISVTMSFKNPVEVELKEGTLTLEGPGILKKLTVKLDRPVAINGTFEETVRVTPKYPGEREIVAVFNSKQLINISGAVMVDVQEA